MWASAPTPGPLSATVFSEGQPLRVLLVGDSIAEESSGPFTFALSGSVQATVTTEVLGGTALCDWLPGLPAELLRVRPEVVVLEFVGNAFTPCTRDSTTGEPLSGVPLAIKYGADAARAAAMFRDDGVAIYWANAPRPRSADSTSALIADAAAAGSAAVTPTHRIDAGDSVLISGEYTDYLPCLPFEPCTGVDAAGQPAARVRAPDGLHFCPVATATVDGLIASCPVWSSGAWRYGLALAAPISHDYGHR
jgi:hypothetical protein